MLLPWPVNDYFVFITFLLKERVYVLGLQLKLTLINHSGSRAKRLPFQLDWRFLYSFIPQTFLSILY